MTIFSDRDIRNALKNGEIKIDPPLDNDCIGAGSVDLALSDVFYIPKKSVSGRTIRDLSKTDFTDVYDKVKMDSVTLLPGDCILAATEEKLTLILRQFFVDLRSVSAKHVPYIVNPAIEWQTTILCRKARASETTSA